MENKAIKYLLDKGVICYVDYHFAKFSTGLTGKEDTKILLAAALVSSKTREGHICISLGEYAGKCLIADDEATRCPELNEWVEALRSCGIVGRPDEGLIPLVLDDKNRLYLYRYWKYEASIAKSIKRYVTESKVIGDIEEITEKLKVLFPAGENNKIPDLQKVAAYTAMLKKLTIISGGPGTGKTTTVAKILALLISSSVKRQASGVGASKRQASGRQASFAFGDEVKIMLAAPTGKAAARLQESIKSFKSRARRDGLGIPDEILELIPEEASTIHRLLGSIPNSPYFRHNSKNPLRLDVLVVDEASMIDVPLMAKLLEALPENAKLIILGDKDQLSSVEAGKFMGDVCTSALKSNYSMGFYQALESITGLQPEEAPGLDDKPSLRECFIHLKTSYRFDNNSGIGELSRLINDGKSQAASELICSGRFSDITMKNVSSEDMLKNELQGAVENYQKYLAAAEHYEKNAGSPADVFRLFEGFRVLCAMREGPFGVNNINELIESILREKRLIAHKKEWYRGMPIMITQNNYGLNLFNGDVGIVLPDRDSGGKLKAYFPSPDGNFRKIHQLRLPEYEKVYAMTVHKSQGSEFKRVLLILPDRQNAVLTRELLYTGLTRAKSNAEIWAGVKVFRETVESNIARSSGLYEALL